MKRLLMTILAVVLSVAGLCLPARAQPKRPYVLLFKPFGWVVGSGYYR